METACKKRAKQQQKLSKINKIQSKKMTTKKRNKSMGKYDNKSQYKFSVYDQARCP